MREEPPPLTPSGLPWWQIVAMGVMLAVLLFGVLFCQPGATTTGTGEELVVVESTPTPELDLTIVNQARDRDRTDRLVIEEKPLEHLLEKSLQVTPAVARKLGMPTDPLPLAQLRANPDRWRGQYLWYKGTLEVISEPKPGHPVPGYSYYEGRLRTRDGDPVLFAFSVPPSSEVRVGAWVRMEGYFLKLRDAHLPVAFDLAPMLVGPEVQLDYPLWEPVTSLDAELLASVKDGVWREADGTFELADDMDRPLVDSQQEPLWHLASYAKSMASQTSDAEWSRVPAFTTKAQLDQVRTGEMAKGTPVRLLGTFQRARIMPARTNPIGVESWTEAWLQIRDLGGKTVPVWIPDRIDQAWDRNQTAVVRGYLFKRHRYTTMENKERWTPLFVAASIERFRWSNHPLTNPITALFGLLVVGVAAFVLWINFRDRRRSRTHEAHLLERRRARRRTTPATPTEPCAS